MGNFSLNPDVKDGRTLGDNHVSVEVRGLWQTDHLVQDVRDRGGCTVCKFFRQPKTAQKKKLLEKKKKKLFGVSAWSPARHKGLTHGQRTSKGRGLGRESEE